jgi:cation transport regulator
VPYSSIDDLPASVRTHLPPHAQEIYVGAFNGAWNEYAREGAEERERPSRRLGGRQTQICENGRQLDRARRLRRRSRSVASQGNRI